MTPLIRMRELRDEWKAAANRVKAELRACASDPAASRASLDSYRGLMISALDHYQQYIFQRADALLEVVEASEKLNNAWGRDSDEASLMENLHLALLKLKETS